MAQRTETQTRRELSLVIPAFNEAAGIEHAIIKAHSSSGRSGLHL